MESGRPPPRSAPRHRLPRGRGGGGGGGGMLGAGPARGRPSPPLQKRQAGTGGTNVAAFSRDRGSPRRPPPLLPGTERGGHRPQHPFVSLQRRQGRGPLPGAEVGWGNRALPAAASSSVGATATGGALGWERLTGGLRGSRAARRCQPAQEELGKGHGEGLETSPGLQGRRLMRERRCPLGPRECGGARSLRPAPAGLTCRKAG